MGLIRVGIIGLSASAKTNWASSAHLPYLRGATDKYLITALCNSSVAAAEKSIAEYGLPSTTKAYGDPKDLAQDPDVDLVVCCTRVDSHYSTVRPSIKAGKNVYVEWPLASRVEEARELALLAQQNGIKSMVGLQGRVSPIIATIKRLLGSGEIGQVLSSSVSASGGVKSRDALPEGLKYFTQKDVGGNVVTIGYAHMIDSIHTALSSEFSSLTARLHIQRPRVPIKDSNAKVLETVTSDVPDLIIVSGTIASSGYPLDVRYRRGQAFKGSPGFEWIITGESGEIRVSGPGPALQAWDNDFKIELYDFLKDEVQNVTWEEEHSKLSVPARNVARLYNAFANGDQSLYADFNDAALRHAELEAVFTSSEDNQHPCSYV